MKLCEPSLTSAAGGVQLQDADLPAPVLQVQEVGGQAARPGGGGQGQAAQDQAQEGQAGRGGGNRQCQGFENNTGENQ